MSKETCDVALSDGEMHPAEMSCDGVESLGPWTSITTNGSFHIYQQRLSWAAGSWHDRQPVPPPLLFTIWVSGLRPL